MKYGEGIRGKFSRNMKYGEGIRGNFSRNIKYGENLKLKTYQKVEIR